MTVEDRLLQTNKTQIYSEMRKETDELRNAIKEKTNRSPDRMVRATDSPFTMAVLECPVPSKFRLPQLEPFDGLKDPQDYLNTFKMTLGLQQPPDKILCRSFPTTLKGVAREWFTKLPTSSIDIFEQLSNAFCTTSSGDNALRGQQTTYSPLDKGRKKPRGRT